MRISQRLPVLTALLSAAAVVQGNCVGNVDPGCAASDPLTSHTIYAYGINATYIGYGARLTHLFVHDKDNNPRDVIVGYDDPAQYIQDTATNHTYFGAVVGRYANRIKNGSFEIDGQSYQIPENENGGRDTLHGGFIGYDARNWTVTQVNESSITFSLFDPSGFQGFPGGVITHATYTVEGSYGGSPARLTTRLISVSLDQTTPIMLANHNYWNLGAFQTATVLNDTLAMPYADRIISIDSLEVPTGAFQQVKYPWTSPPVPLNFTGPKQIGDGALHSMQCGAGCTGIDNAFILDRPIYESPDDLASPQLYWTSPESGISLTVYTNQQSLQLYTCNGQNGTIPVKSGQMGYGVKGVNKYGCMVIETQQLIDGINNPWGQMGRQEFGPTSGPQVNIGVYEFTH